MPLFYFVFDVLTVNGRSLLHLPLAMRKSLLASVAPRLRDPIRHAGAMEGSLRRVIAVTRRHGLEGLVAKRRTSLYRPGTRSPDWLKHRFNQVEAFVVGGYIPGAFPAAFRLLVGQYRKGRLEYVASIRNGFSGDDRERVTALLQPLWQPACPFANLPERKPGPYVLDRDKMKTCVWVQPAVQAEIEFVNWTAEGDLRHAAFRRLLPPMEGPHDR